MEKKKCCRRTGNEKSRRKDGQLRAGSKSSRLSQKPVDYVGWMDWSLDGLFSVSPKNETQNRASWTTRVKCYSNLYDRISPGRTRNIPQNLAGFVYWNSSFSITPLVLSEYPLKRGWGLIVVFFACVFRFSVFLMLWGHEEPSPHRSGHCGAPSSLAPKMAGGVSHQDLPLPGVNEGGHPCPSPSLQSQQ